MADIELRIGGNADGATQALDDVGGAASASADEVGRSVVKWQALASVVTEAAKAAVRFAVDAVRASQEAERINRQLARATGQYAEALDKQAAAMGRRLAVDDDLIKQSQTLLAQWGGVGAAANEVTQAVLDYAAATGKDAVGATQELIQQVEVGGAGLAKLGVAFTATGDRGHDLAAAVAAINAKFGGAAAANADSLNAQMADAAQALGDVQEAFGKVISDFVAGTGVVGQLAEAFRGLNSFLFGDDAEERRHQYGLLLTDQANAAIALKNARDEFAAAMRQDGLGADVIEMFADDVKRAEANLKAAKQAAADFMGVAMPGTSSVTGRTAAGARADAAAAPRARAQQKLGDDVAKIRNAQDDAEMDAAQEQEAKLLALAASSSEKLLDAKEKELQAIQAAEAKHYEQQWESTQAATRKRIEEARATADAIGAAFVDAFSTQLDRLAEGGEVDAGEMVGDIMASVLAIAGTAVGAYFGAPQVGAAVGGLAGSAVRAATRKRKQTYHDGGWVEPELPRHHDGAWIGADERAAILQTGERVLSRGEVSRMGGPSQVDRAAKGGPAVVVNVSALDSRSAAESFTTDVGRGLWRAKRTGRGDVARMLGVR